VNCQEITDLMDGYLDGELDPITSQKIEQHLRDCRKCKQTYEAHTALARAISQGAPYYKASTELRQRVQSSYGKQSVQKQRTTVGDRTTCWFLGRAQSGASFFLTCHGTG